MERAISIVGPTAVGKSAFALAVAHEVLEQSLAPAVHLISADSRQVFQGLEVLTGADIPPDFERREAGAFPFEYFQHASRPLFLHGVSVLDPSQEWSVAQFSEFARKVVQQADAEQALVVIVGGTGLYQEKVFATDLQLQVPPDQRVRQQAAAMSTQELQDWVQRENPEKWQQMNNSDRHNPRRLVRALELVQIGGGGEAQVDTEQTLQTQGAARDDARDAAPKKTLTIGLSDSLEAIQGRITARVQERLKTGALQEVARLVDAERSLSKQARSTIGVRELAALAVGDAEPTTIAEAWAKREFQYAKRQLTWWKKYGQVEWYLVSDSGWREQAIRRVLAFLR